MYDMLSQANLSVPDTLGQFKDRGISVGFLVPTETGLSKSIMDAHEGLRTYLKAKGAHDFDTQLQGNENKKSIRTFLLADGKTLETKTSLYRPESKSGDPRIWVYGLASVAGPGDLLALAFANEELIVINCSRSELDILLSGHNSFLSRAFPIATERELSPVAQELLLKMSEISARGYIKTMRSGDTGVGYTLESLLGIEANSSKAPDYKGIELKAARVGKGRAKQTTIFSQVPKWSSSSLKGSREILEKHGRFNIKKSRKQVYHEISATKLNSYNLQLEVDESSGMLYQVFLNPENEMRQERDVVWEIDHLVSRVEEKHKETMWISALARGKRSEEEFFYHKLKHTRGVDPAALQLLLDSGEMTVHYLIKELPSGAAKDQGYLFKMAPKYLPILFDKITIYDLVA
jgi:hypothetical protein